MIISEEVYYLVVYILSKLVYISYTKYVRLIIELYLEIIILYRIISLITKLYLYIKI